MVDISRWIMEITRAINVHFNAAKGTTPLYVEGTLRTTNVENAWVEIKVIGPFFQRLKEDTLVQFKVRIDCFEKIPTQGNDIYSLPLIAGKFMAAMIENINIEYLDACARSANATYHFLGEVKYDTPLRTATIEANYSFVIEG